MGSYKRKADGAESHQLILNPIFTSMAEGYGRRLRDTTNRLTLYLTEQGKTGKAGKSAAMYAFMQLLEAQDRRKVWNISLENLLLHLNLLDYFKKNKKNVIKKLEEIFEAFFSLGLLLEKPTPTLPLDGVYHFKLNPDPKSQINPKNILPENGSTPT